MNYKEIYLWGKQELEKAFVVECDLDARLLLEHICGTNRNTLLVHGDREVTVEEEKEYRVLLDGTNLGNMTTNIGGKLVISVDLTTGQPQEVVIERI
mgnify:CR=1 FL=1